MKSRTTHSRERCVQARKQQMNQFTELYKTFSDSDLLKITRSPDDYQPDAVVAARKEIDARQLTDEELKTAEAELEKEAQVKRQKEEKRKAVENKVKGFASSLNPINEAKPTTERQILLLTVVFGFMSVYRFFSEWETIGFMFFNAAAEWDVFMVLYFAILFVLPISVLLLWFRKKIGWVLLTGFLSYSSFETIGAFIGSVTYEPSGFASLDALTPTISPVTHILTLALFVGSIWVLAKPDLRDTYSIDKKTLILTIVIGFVLPASTYLALFL